MGGFSLVTYLIEGKANGQVEKEAAAEAGVLLEVPIAPIKSFKPFTLPSHVNLSNLPVQERKKKFIEIMLPLIEKANGEVLKERAFLLSILHKKKLSPEEERKLKALEKKYKADSLQELLKRVAPVPVSLVLAQAAVESGWGTSRFFTEANNAFGIYTYKKNKCLKAKKGHACLKVYDNLYQSVKDYIYNLNVGWAYEKFRELRSKGAGLDALLAALTNYSELRGKYGQLVKAVIDKNNLRRFDGPELASRSTGSKQLEQ